MARMMTSAPTQKVVGATLGGSLSVIALYLIESALTGVTIPDQIETAVMTIMTFFAGYFVPPGQVDVVIVDRPTPNPPAGG